MACIRFGVYLLLFAVVACSSTIPVHPYGPETYVVFVDSFSKSKARNTAISTANEYCIEKGQQMMPESETPTASLNLALGAQKHEVRFVFRCLEPGDKDLQRPDVDHSPDIVIEEQLR